MYKEIYGQPASPPINREKEMAADRRSRWISWVVVTLLGFAIIAALFILVGSWFTVPAGYKGIVTRFGSVQETVYTEGVHFKWPLVETSHDVDARVLTHTSKAVDAGTRDLQSVMATVAVQFQVNDNIKDFYRNYRDTGTVVNRVLDPAIEESVKAVTAKYQSEELIAKRAQVRDEVFSTLREKVKPYYITTLSLSITNFSFSQAFNAAIEAKVTAEQHALKAKNDLDRIKTESEQRVVRAQAEAQAIKIQAEAIQKQGGAEYVQLQWINKWNGQQPSTVLGQTSSPLLNIGK